MNAHQRRPLWFLLGLFLLFSCSQQPTAPTPTPLPPPSPTVDCATLSVDYMDDVDNLLARWRDARDIANATPRLTLAGPLADLQAIRRELVDLDVPPCVEAVTAPLAAYMDHGIQAALLFMAQESDEDVAAEIELASAQFDIYEEERVALGWETIAEIASPAPLSPTDIPPTIAAAPTQTLEPREALKIEIDSLLGSSNRGLDERLTYFTHLPNNDGYQIEIQWALQEGASIVETLEAAQVEASEMLRLVAESGLPYEGGVELSGTFVLADAFGDTIEDEVISARFDRATIERIQWPNFRPAKVFTLADSLSMQNQFEQAAKIIDERTP